MTTATGHQPHLDDNTARPRRRSAVRRRVRLVAGAVAAMLAVAFLPQSAWGAGTGSFEGGEPSVLSVPYFDGAHALKSTQRLDVAAVGVPAYGATGIGVWPSGMTITITPCYSQVAPADCGTPLPSPPASGQVGAVDIRTYCKRATDGVVMLAATTGNTFDYSSKAWARSGSQGCGSQADAFDHLEFWTHDWLTSGATYTPAMVGAFWPSGHPNDLGDSLDLSAGACSLSDAQLVALARGEGFGTAGGGTDGDLVTAVAVALAESGGVVNAQHTNDNGTTDLGLWQVNSSHAANKAQQVRLGTDPYYNASVAVAIWQDAGHKFTPWTTYATKAHLKFLSRAQAAVAANPDAVLRHDVSASADWLPGGCDGFAATPGAGGSGADPNDDGTSCGWSPSSWGPCLFVPKQSSWDQFTSMGDDLAHVFPFGFITDGLGMVNTVLTECAVQDNGVSNGCGGYVTVPSVKLPDWAGGDTLVLLPSPDSAVATWTWAHRGVLELLVWVGFLVPLTLGVWRRLFPAVNE